MYAFTDQTNCNIIQRARCAAQEWLPPRVRLWQVHGSGLPVSSSPPFAKQLTVWAGSGGFWDYEAAHISPFEKKTGISVSFQELPSATGLSKEEIALRAHNSSFAMYETPTSVSYYNVAFGAQAPYLFRQQLRR